MAIKCEKHVMIIVTILYQIDQQARIKTHETAQDAERVLQTINSASCCAHR